jgi:hypothetical protein
MKEIISVSVVVFLFISIGNVYSQEGNYKIGDETWVIEKSGYDLIIRHSESFNGWVLSKPYDYDGKIGFDAVNSGGIIEFWLIFDDDSYQKGIMERKYGQNNLEIKKLG